MDASQLESIDSITGEVPEARFKDGNAARAVFETLLHDDRRASAKRAKIQRMYYGEPPYPPEELERAGQKFRTNINMGDAEDLLYDARGAYIDMLQSVESLFTCPTKHGATPEERKRFSKAVCRATSNMIKRWPEFHHRYLLNATNFITQGVSFAMFQDDIDWRFQVKDLNDFHLPRTADACESCWEVAFARDEWSITQLYRAIANEDAAEKMGWNVKATKEFLKSAAKSSDGKTDFNSWEDLATKMKTDDLAICSQSGDIEMLFCFVREFDGTITVYTLPRYGAKDAKDFLRVQKKKFKSMSDAVTLFAYTVGNKGKLYEIRGQGERIFAPVQANNRMYCLTIDAAALGSSMVIRPRSMSDLGRQQLAYHGPYTMLHPGAEIVESKHVSLSESTLVVVRQMSDIIGKKSNTYSSSRALPDSREMSKEEISARISQAAGMTVTNLILFLDQFEKLLRQMVKRIQRKGYSESLPGGDLIAELHQDLEDEGIPLEALYELDVRKLKAVRPVGAGSAAARENEYRKLRELAPGFDEEGRRNLIRDTAAAITGSYESADDYIPEVGTERVPEGTQLAILQNFAMKDGNQCPVFSEEFHVAHLEQHTGFMVQYIQQTQEGQLRLEDAVPILATIHEHSVQHLQFLENDPFAQAEAAQFKQVLQQSGEIIFNGMRRLRAEAEQAAAEGAEAGVEGQAPNPEEEKHAAKLRREMEEHAIRMQLLSEKTQAEIQMAMLKANTAAQINEAMAVSKMRANRLAVRPTTPV